jgi:hypothetical protein
VEQWRREVEEVGEGERGGWGKRESGWGKRESGWGKRESGWGDE